MNAYYIANKITGETDLFFGYSFSDVCKQYNLNENEWYVQIVEPKETEAEYDY